MADLLGELLSVLADWHADALSREYQAWLPLDAVDDGVEDEAGAAPAARRGGELMVGVHRVA